MIELKEKIDKLIELVADQSMVGSSHGHNLSDLDDNVSELKESFGRLEERIKNIDDKVEVIEKRFSLTKIFATMFTIFSTAVGTITACLVLLKYLGVLELIKETVRAAGIINGIQ